MKKDSFNVGDKVLFRSPLRNGEEIPTIKNLKVISNYSELCKQWIITDVALVYDNGRVCRTSRKEIYKPNYRTLKIHGKYRWEVKGVKERNGYFGSYSCIELDGKKAIVFCDDSDAIVNVITDWFDDIIYNNDWSGDNRWNYDKPIVVYEKDKGYNLNAVHENNLLCDEWLKNIEPKWIHDNTIGCYVNGENFNGEKVIISQKGTIHLKELSNPKNIENVLKSVKQFTNEEVLHLWIEKNLPCAYIRGIEYKGSKWGRITKDVAIELYKTHNSFDTRFNSVEWRVLDNQVTLLFRDYCNSDYD